MRTLYQIALCAGAAALLLGCTGGTAAPNSPSAQHKAAAARGWWLLPGKMEELPPVVDTLGYNPLDMPDKKSPGYVNPYPQGTYEHFAAQKSYPANMQVYEDEKLLGLITAANAKIIICLPQQRARLYVYGRVAMDWPVSTGVKGHSTPTGAFRIIEKARDHHSSRYGRWIVDGKVVDNNADTTRSAPEGAIFSPSGMPHWHRLTWDGVGIHGGKVVAGRRLSHGCIRSPFSTARKVFNYTIKGMPVYISRAVEDYARGGILRPEDVRYRPNGENTEPAAVPAS